MRLPRSLDGDPRLAAFIQYVTQPVGQVFLRLLFMLVVPLVFSALALGVAGLGDLRHVGRVGVKTLAYTVVVSAIAVFLGIFLVNVLRPGEGISEELQREAQGVAVRARPWRPRPTRRPAASCVQIVHSNRSRPQTRRHDGVMFFRDVRHGMALAHRSDESVERR